MAINITKKTGTANTTASSDRSIKYIVIHYTAGVSSKSGMAASTASWFANTAAKASADFIVDDANIIQYNPDPAGRYCWAVGGGKYGTKGGSLYGKATNANCISIEICSTNLTGKVTDANDANWYFTDAAVEKAAELTLYLMDKYGIDSGRVIRHYDVNGKPCPGIRGWNEDTGSTSEWEAFKAMLAPDIAKGDKLKTLQRIPLRDGMPTKSQGAGYVKYKTLKSAAAKKKCRKTRKGNAVLKKGRKVVVQEVKTAWNGNTWVKIKIGGAWIPVTVAGKSRVKRI